MDQTSHIRSFVRRQARMTPLQTRSLENLAGGLVVPYQATPVDWAKTFGREAPLVLEIGFGMGHATAAIAAANPGTNYLGVEVHAPGVGALLARIADQNLSNIRIVQDDAVLVLQNMVAPFSLSAVHVFFPDPWPKKRHHKRRLIQASFLRDLASRVAPGGRLCLATDWADYAAWMLDGIAGSEVWRNLYQDFAPVQDWRPRTAFESKGLAKDHRIFEIVCQKT